MAAVLTHCKRCSAALPRIGPQGGGRPFYCGPCRREVKREVDRAYRARKRGPSPRELLAMRVGWGVARREAAE